MNRVLVLGLRDQRKVPELWSFPIHIIVSRDLCLQRIRIGQDLRVRHDFRPKVS